jgi:hypothetical protein
LAELGLVLALYIVPLVLSVIDVSRLGMVTQLLTNACRDGCRVAVMNGNTASDVTTRVNQALTAAGIGTSLVTSTLSPTNPTTVPVGSPITLTLSMNFSSVSWLPTPFLFGSDKKIVASTTMSSEQL